MYKLLLSPPQSSDVARRFIGDPATIKTLINEHATKPIDVYSIYFLLSFIPALGVGKYGAYANYYIELCLTTAILAGVGFKYMLESSGARSRVIALFLLCLQMNNLTAVEFNGENLSISRKPGWSYFPSKTDYDNGAKLVDTIKNLTGQGFSEGDNTVLLLAGKQIEYHYFLRYYIPAWNPGKFLNDLSSGRYGFFVSNRLLRPERANCRRQ